MKSVYQVEINQYFFYNHLKIFNCRPQKASKINVLLAFS